MLRSCSHEKQRNENNCSFVKNEKLRHRALHQFHIRLQSQIQGKKYILLISYPECEMQNETQAIIILHIFICRLSSVVAYLVFVFAFSSL